MNWKKKKNLNLFLPIPPVFRSEWHLKLREQTGEAKLPATQFRVHISRGLKTRQDTNIISHIRMLFCSVRWNVRKNAVNLRTPSDVIAVRMPCKNRGGGRSLIFLKKIIF